MTGRATTTIAAQDGTRRGARRSAHCLVGTLFLVGCAGSSCDGERATDTADGGAQAAPEGGGGAGASVLDLGPLPEVPITCVTTSETVGSAPRVSEGGDWLQFRHDRRLSGRSPLVGRLSCPTLKWVFDLGARESFVVLEEGETNTGRIAAPLGDLGDDPVSFDTAWFLGGRVVDLGGMWSDGRESEKLADLIAGGAIERLTCQAFTDPDPAGMPCYLQRVEGSDWTTIWKSAPLPSLDYGNTGSESPIAGDFDGDGKMEAAFRPWNEVVVVDLATGQLEQRGIFEYDAFIHNIYGAPWPECPASEIPKWPNTDSCFVLLQDRPYDGTGRGYGWFGAAQLDATPELEFVIIGIAEQFVSVLAYDGGQLVERWKRRINSFVNPKPYGTSVVPAIAPIADIDGDGAAEIVVSVFNENNDGRWHVIALEAETGAVVLDLADAHLSGLGDVDGDSVHEIFVTETIGELVPAPSTASIYSFLNRQRLTLFSREGTNFVQHRVLHLPTTVNVSPDVERKDLLLTQDDGMTVFFTEQPDLADPRSNIIERWRVAKSGAIESVGSAAGPALEIASVQRRSGNGDGVLFRMATTQTSLSQLDVDGWQGSFVLSRRRFGPMSGAVVARLSPADSMPTVIIEQAPEQVVALQIEDGKVAPRWVIQGRGNVQAINWNAQHQSPFGAYESIVLADVMGDGGFAALVAGRGPKNQARLSAYDAEGKAHWHRDFDSIRGGAPDALIAGLSLYSVGRFSDRDRDDVLVQFVLGRRDEIEVIDGQNGKSLWRRTAGGSSCADIPYRVGGQWMAAVDIDGDGTQEIVNTTDRQFVIFDGGSGDMLVDRVAWGCWQTPELNMFDDETFMQMVPSVLPVVMELHSQSGLEVLYGSFGNGTAIVDLTGDSLWVEPTDAIADSPFRDVLQAIGDFDGDGEREILDFGYCQDGDPIVSRSAETGKVLWSLSLETACAWKPTTAAVADLDGDGRDEAVFGVGFELYAVGTNAAGDAGEVRFIVELPGIAATPIIADADGSGTPQILVGTDAGYLVAIGE